MCATVSVEDVVPEDEAGRGLPHGSPANDEGLREPVRAGLLGVGEAEFPVGTVLQQVAGSEAGRRVWR